MDTNCAPFLAELFLHSYEAEFTEKRLHENKPLAVAFNSTFRYIDDVFILALATGNLVYLISNKGARRV
jgi:hypothetical protein